MPLAFSTEPLKTDPASHTEGVLEFCSLAFTHHQHAWAACPANQLARAVDKRLTSNAFQPAGARPTDRPALRGAPPSWRTASRHGGDGSRCKPVWVPPRDLSPLPPLPPLQVASQASLWRRSPSALAMTPTSKRK